MLVKYLVEHGASLFLTTNDGDTPLTVAQKEKVMEERAEGGGGGKGKEKEGTGMDDCLHYLQGERVLMIFSYYQRVR